MQANVQLTVWPEGAAAAAAAAVVFRYLSKQTFPAAFSSTHDLNQTVSFGLEEIYVFFFTLESAEKEKIFNSGRRCSTFFTSLFCRENSCGLDEMKTLQLA